VSLRGTSNEKTKQTTTHVELSEKAGFVVKISGKVYDFEWMKGLGIGKRESEIGIEDSKKIAQWRDKKGRKIFRLD